MEINDKLVSYVAELAHLKIDEAQREQAAADLARMIGYVDQLSELDTTGVEPMSHAFPVVNVFREDEVKPSMERELILKNAQDVKDGCFLVPKTVVTAGKTTLVYQAVYPQKLGEEQIDATVDQMVRSMDVLDDSAQTQDVG